MTNKFADKYKICRICISLNSEGILLSKIYNTNSIYSIFLYIVSFSVYIAYAKRTVKYSNEIFRVLKYVQSLS